ncbi:MAG: hypothetical protein Q9M28_10205 [Mariprofundaceae bacterium]|nr:hypothetical protein [Mariprofundaceae bacterium]
MVEILGKVWTLSAFVGFFQKTFKDRNSNGFIMNAMTNMDPIDAEKVHFGDVAITHAMTTAPLIDSPNMLLGLSGFSETLTLSCGYFQPEEEDPIRAVFAQVEAVLQGLD